MPSSTDSLPFDRAVNCDCDRSFHLPLALLISPDSEPAHACVRCGRIMCTEVLWTHVHHNTYEPHGRREHPVTEETRAWLDRWPRVLQGNDFNDYAFLPATVRCSDVTDLQLQTARASASRSLPRGRRLREAGIPALPPPASLPQRLNNYRTLWELGQRLTPDCDAGILLKNARPVYQLSSPLALDALLQRADLPELLASTSASDDIEDVQTVCAVVREDPATLPHALPGLLAWLERHVGRPHANLGDYRLHALLDFFAAQKNAATEIVLLLETLKARVSHQAFEFMRKLTETIRALNGEPPLPISQAPWFFSA